MLVVDDAHLLDAGSAAVVHQAAHTGVAGVVATVRSPEPLPEGVGALWRDRLLPRVEIQPLTRGDVAQLLSDALNGPVAPDTEARIWEVARGYPLYVHELVESTLEDGTLELDAGGAWRLASDAALPSRVREVVRSRLGRLAEDQQIALELAALAPGTPSEIIAALTSHEALDRLEDRGLVEIAPGADGDQVRLAHPILGELAVTRIGADTLDDRRRQLGRALADRPDQATRAALLLLECGESPEQGLLDRALRQASDNVDPELVRRLASAAVESTGEVMHRVTLGSALARLDRWDEAEVEFERARADAGPDATPMVVMAWAHAAFENVVDLTAAERVLDQLVEAGRTHAGSAHIALRVQMMGSQSVSVMKAGLEALLARDDVDHRTRSLALLDVSGGYWYSGLFAQSLEAIDDIAVSTLPLVDQLRVHFTAVADHLWSGEVDRAEAERRARLPDGVDEVDCQLCASLASAMVAGWAGDAADAVRHVRTLLETAPVASDGRILELHAPELALIASEALDADRVLSGIGVLVEAAGGVPYAASGQWLHARSRFLRPVRPDEADDVLARAIATAREAETPIHEARGLFDLVLLGRAEEASSRLTELASGPAGQGLVCTWAEAAVAVDAADGVQLESLAEAAGRGGAHGLAADLALLANRAHARNDAPGAAYRAARRHARARSRTSGRLSLVGSTSALVLTEREVGICDAVVDGRTNRQIADDLVVSVRTVEGHLHRSYRKLGVDGRDGLLALVGADGHA